MPRICATAAILPLGHHPTPPNVPNVCYRPNNIMVEDLPSSSSNPYPPIPPDVVQILGTRRGAARTDDDLRRLLDALDPVLGGADDVWAALSPRQQTELCRHVEMRTVRDNDGDKVDEYYLGGGEIVSCPRRGRRRLGGALTEAADGAVPARRDEDRQRQRRRQGRRILSGRWRDCHRGRRVRSLRSIRPRPREGDRQPPGGDESVRRARPGWVGGTLANSSSGWGGMGTTVDRLRRRRRGSIVSQPGGTTTAKTPPP